MLARRGVEDRAQFRMNRKQKLNTGLALLDVQGWPVVCLADVLPPHADHIAAPLCGVEQQCEREARLGADRMMCLELRDLVFRPRVESVALDRALFDVCGRVRSQPSALDRKLTKRAQRHQPTACGVRRLGVKQRLDPFGWQ